MDDVERIAQEMRGAAERATPGPWFINKPSIDPGTGYRRGVAVAATYGRQTIYADPPGGSYPAADQRHIAASNPANVLAILDRLAEVTRERDEAREKRDDMEMSWNALAAERDALAGLLREAGEWIGLGLTDEQSRNALLAKIESALNAKQPRSCQSGKNGEKGESDE